MSDTRFLNISTQLKRVADIENKDERREELRKLLTTRAIATLVQYAYHPEAVFDLPEGPIPESQWKKSSIPNHRGLLREARKLSHLLVGSPVNKMRKQMIYIQILETLEPSDAELVISIVNKRLPWKTLNQSFVTNAVPELFPVKETV